MQQVAVLGLGKVGGLVADLLEEAGFSVKGYDAAERAMCPHFTAMLDCGNQQAMARAFADVDAVVSCLPYHLNIGVASAAHAAGVHYFDLTEDVPTTQAIMELAKTSSGAMVPQCGLAPGIIGIIGAHLAAGFDDLDVMHLRVGALPCHPHGVLGYAFNWSAEGVINEYINPCEVIHNRQNMLVPALEQIEKLVIDGVAFEAFTTSGGLGTMCESYLGKIRELNYKSIRYPGHAAAMKLILEELHLAEDRALAMRILMRAKPPVDEDVVYLYASVNGTKDGHAARKEYVRVWYPQDIASQKWRAISWTTAASLVAVVELVAKGRLPQKGFIRQEDIDLDALLNTTAGGYYQKAEKQGGRA